MAKKTAAKGKAAKGGARDAKQERAEKIVRQLYALRNVLLAVFTAARFSQSSSDWSRIKSFIKEQGVHDLTDEEWDVIYARANAGDEMMLFTDSSCFNGGGEQRTLRPIEQER